jgi:DNA-binding SARP family transcriptional activator
MASLKLYLLGVPRIELDEQLVTIQRRKALALLFYLAINAKSQSRDTLATLLWPDNNQKQARLALDRHLFELREQLGGDWLESDHQTIGLRADAGLWLDVDLFQRHLATCADAIPMCRAILTQAVSLYRADFLTGFSLLDCPEFDEWQFFQSEGLRQQFAAALERLIQIQHDQDDYEAAIPHAWRWVALDPLHEPAQRYLMQLYAQTGQQAAALRQYQLCRQTLEDELGAAPDAQTTMLYERIRSRALRSSAREQENQGIREKEPAEGLSVVPRPSGTVTFLFSDIEGSTALWERHPHVMREALARHDALLLAAIAAHSGARVKGTGDGIHAAFARAPDALRAALAAQRALHGQDWGATPIKVRMALHTAAAEERDGDYFGPPLNRAARLPHGLTKDLTCDNY